MHTPGPDESIDILERLKEIPREVYDTVQATDTPSLKVLMKC